MKQNTQQKSGQELNTVANVSQLLQSIYGKTVTVDFDKHCIKKVEVNLENGLLREVFVTYDKTKVVHADGTVAYCPIQQYRSDYNMDAALKLIQELKCSE